LGIDTANCKDNSQRQYQVFLRKEEGWEISMEWLSIILAIDFIFTAYWLYVMNKYANEKTFLMKEKFQSVLGFIFIFLFSPILVIAMWIGDYLATQKKKNEKT
jgi:hypothetical protein